MMEDLDFLMDFAVRTVEGAGLITQAHFGSAAVSFKGDGSELTLADTGSEDFIREAIVARFPEHGILGEEGSRVDSSGRYRWIVDPIDGTRSFAAGVPLYGILMALEVDGVPTVGCCHFPAMGDTIVAATGAGCWRAGKRVSVSACDRLEEARVVTSGLEYWRDWATPSGHEGLNRLIGGSRFARTWGDCFGYILVATGRAEILADPACGAHWDYAPMVPILAEAGGRFTTLDDRPVRAWSSALATNGRLHAAAMGCWNGATEEQIQTAVVRAKG
ncbi:MAG: histidinol phosphate phosphatase [Gemmatimonadota bacterium]|jgi:histidinol phosphatase-like enzyme (inositol monophosphatase family)|nr:histidinol phosphate phosphatase [Gemmatimonadota bacterium]